MSVARIGHFQAKPETIQTLREFIISIMPMIKGSAGCEACQLFQSQDDATRFTMIEVWDRIESHKVSVKNIPPEKIREIGPLLASPPGGSYYDMLAEK